MEQIYKVEKINMSGKRRTPGGLKRYSVGDVFVCRDKAEYDFLITYEKNHWKDVTEFPAPPEPIVAKPKSKGKKGAK